MSENTKLQPEDLTAEERALWDALAVERVARNSCRPEQAYEFTDDWASRLILARRALFATEKAKCVLHEEIVRDGPSKWTCETQPDPAKEKAVCPNCKRDDTGHSWKVNGELRYSCNGWNKPAQPEPADSRQDRADQIKSFLGGDDDEPAQLEPTAPEMPLPLQIAMDALAGAASFARLEAQSDANYVVARKTLASWWRTHSQPVAVGMTEELRKDIEWLVSLAYDKANDHDHFCRNNSFGKPEYSGKLRATCGRVQNFVRQQPAQGKP